MTVRAGRLFTQCGWGLVELRSLPFPSSPYSLYPACINNPSSKINSLYPHIRCTETEQQTKRTIAPGNMRRLGSAPG